MSVSRGQFVLVVPEGLAEDPTVVWAIGRLSAQLVSLGLNEAAGGLAASGQAAVLTVRLLVDAALPAESFGIASGADGLVVRAGDPVGLAYGLNELADLAHSAEDPLAALRQAKVEPVIPAAPVRGIVRTFSSQVLDLPWFRSRDFWTAYLDELAADRVNRFQLALGMQYNYSHDYNVRDAYLCFAYPFLVAVPGWERVRVEGLSQSEREDNLAALQFASQECARRGIHFQLGLWNHALRPEITDSPDLLYPVRGLADDQVADYSGQALRELLRLCPAISGVTFRVHYEGGVPEKDHVPFWRSVMSGLEGVGRPFDVDMHSKGVDVELIKTAQATGAHVIVSAKYWAEHQGLPYHQTAVRPMEAARPADDDDFHGLTQNARRFTRYGYGDFLGEDRQYDTLFRIWPGSQRFLVWADPELFAGYGRLSTLGGALGAELCEPLAFRGRKASADQGIPRDLYADPELSQGLEDWRKYAYEYRLWGRLMYDPTAGREPLSRGLSQAFGRQTATQVVAALSAAGKVLPLLTVSHSLSASNNYFWPEVFTDMPIARHAHNLGVYDFDLADPGTWGSVCPLDPEMFESANDYAQALVAGRPTGKMTPAEVAKRLLSLAKQAESAIDAAEQAVDDPGRADFRRLAVDARIQALLARFFAGKIRAGIGYALHDVTGQVRYLQAAFDAYRLGRQALAAIVSSADGVYARNLAFGDRPTEQGHWSDRLALVDKDIEDLKNELYDELIERSRQAGRSASEVQAAEPAGPGAVGLAGLDPLDPPTRPCPQPVSHVPAAGFNHGRPLEVRLAAPAGLAVDIHVRHLNQGQQWQAFPMTLTADGFSFTIPGEFTQEHFPLQYFFTLRTADGHGAWIHPGLDQTLANQPYYVVQAFSARRE